VPIRVSIGNEHNSNRCGSRPPNIHWDRRCDCCKTTILKNAALDIILEIDVPSEVFWPSEIDVFKRCCREKGLKALSGHGLAPDFGSARFCSGALMLLRSVFFRHSARPF
jgi:hypothetical protein